MSPQELFFFILKPRKCSSATPFSIHIGRLRQGKIIVEKSNDFQPINIFMGSLDR